MTLSVTDLAADLAEMIADLPAVLTWGAQSVTGTMSELGSELSLSVPGLTTEATHEWNGSVSGFAGSVPPAANSQVSVADLPYRVTRTELDPTGVAVRLMLRKL